MKLNKDQIICGLCREIIAKKESKEFLDWIEWGSLSGSNHYGECCKKHKLNSDKSVPGRAYA